VLTVSTSVSRREAEDESGPLLAELAEGAGAEVLAMEVVPDDDALIEDRIRHYVDDEFALVLTTGGTGLTRGVVGAAQRTLIINFPGSPRAVRQLFDVVAPVLGHAVATLTRDGGRGGGH